MRAFALLIMKICYLLNDDYYISILSMMTCFIPCKNRRKHQTETRQYSSVSLWLWDICHSRRSLNQMGQVWPGSSLLGSLSKLCQTPTLCCSWAIGFRVFFERKGVIQIRMQSIWQQPQQPCWIFNNLFMEQCYKLSVLYAKCHQKDQLGLTHLMCQTLPRLCTACCSFESENLGKTRHVLLFQKNSLPLYLSVQ